MSQIILQKQVKTFWRRADIAIIRKALVQFIFLVAINNILIF